MAKTSTTTYKLGWDLSSTSLAYKGLTAHDVKYNMENRSV